MAREKTRGMEEDEGAAAWMCAFAMVGVAVPELELGSVDPLLPSGGGREGGSISVRIAGDTDTSDLCLE